MFMAFCQRQTCSMFIWQRYQQRSWFIPFHVKFSKPFERDDARFDSHCVQDTVHFGICRDKIFPFAFTGVLWYPLNSQFLADVVIVFPLLTLCEALVLPVSVDFPTATTAAYVSSTFFTGCLNCFTDFSDPLGLSIFSPCSATCHPHQGLIVSPRHSLALCLVWNCHVHYFQRICCTIALRSLPIL